MSKLKQVIIIRADLKMRRGKEIAQGSHASMEFIRKRILNEWKRHERMAHITMPKPYESVEMFLYMKEIQWMHQGHAKICVRVNSTQELFDLHKQATDAGLESHLILDEGLTEFNHIKTVTALAIGPDFAELIDPITGNLEIY